MKVKQLQHDVHNAAARGRDLILIHLIKSSRKKREIQPDNQMRNYQIAVVCTDTTTFTFNYCNTDRKSAQIFAEGVKTVYIKQGKSIYFESIKLIP